VSQQVWIRHGACADLRAEAALHPRLETGGLLLGYLAAQGAVITTVTGPGPGARRTGVSFLPDARWQEQALAAVYVASGKTVSYLGDWHTHPQGTTVMSVRDRRTLTRVAGYGPARQATPLTAILAPDPEGRLVVWQHAGRWRRPVRCLLTVVPGRSEGHS